MDTITAARRLAEPIGEFGARFMLDPDTFARSVELGLPASLASYVQGRIGVMGEVDTATVIDNKLFFDAGLVARYWEEPCGLSKSEAGVAYASICAERGAAYLDGFSDAPRLAELLERVADSADDSKAALFAGWRDAARPDDDHGRAYLLIATIRELRGCRHMWATRTAGADPLGMVLANGGEQTAKLHGYGDRYLDHTAADADQVAAVEAMTDEANAADFSCLTDNERAELVALVEAAVDHAAER